MRTSACNVVWWTTGSFVATKAQGDMRRIQFDTLAELLRIYEGNGLRAIDQCRSHAAAAPSESRRTAPPPGTSRRGVGRRGAGRLLSGT